MIFVVVVVVVVVVAAQLGLCWEQKVETCAIRPEYLELKAQREIRPC